MKTPGTASSCADRMRDGKLQVEWGSMEVVCEHVSYNHFELSAPVFGAAFPASFETDAANRVVALHADLGAGH